MGSESAYPNRRNADGSYLMSPGREKESFLCLGVCPHPLLSPRQKSGFPPGTWRPVQFAETGWLNIAGVGKRVRIHIGESDQYHGRPLFLAILEALRTEGCAGATVSRSIAGFGATSRIHTATIRG